MQVQALPIITRAFVDLGAYASGEAISSADSADGLARLNNLLDEWQTQNLTKPFRVNQIFPLTSGQLSYTMGTGGNFNVVRPTQIDGAGVILDGTSPAIESPRAVITDDGYEAIQIKALQNALLTGVYFSPQYASDQAIVSVWPVATANLNLKLYWRPAIASFPSLTANASLPPGATSTLEYQLAVRLAEPYGRTVPPNIVRLAGISLRQYKKQNYRFVDMPQDPATTGDRRGGYNILTGNI